MSTLIRPLVPRMEYGLRFIEKRIPYSFSAFLICLCLSIQLSAQKDSTMSCYGRVNIGLSPSGETFIQPYHVTGRNTDSTVVSIQGRSIPRVRCTDLNEVLIYELTDTTTGLSCWGELLVEDKSPYNISCRDSLISCEFELSSIGPEGFVTVIDKCKDLGDLSVGFVDSPITKFKDNQDTIGVIERTWTTTDVTGLVRTCVSNLYLATFDLDRIVFPSDTTLDCGQDPDDTAVAGDINFDRDLLARCEVVVTSSLSSPNLHDCGLSTKYFKYWTAVDWHSGRMRDTVQIIIIQDEDGIKLDAPDSFSQVLDSCREGIILPAPGVIADCANYDPSFVDVGVNGAFYNVGDTVYLDPGVYQVIYRPNGGCLSMIEPDTASVEIIIPDAPVLDCSAVPDKAFSLGTNTSINILLDSAFRSVPVLSCVDYNILGRKGNSGDFTRGLTFTIEESIDTSHILIQILARNENGLDSDTCEVWVVVQEKVPPTLDLQPNVIVSITDPVLGTIEVDTSILIASLSDNSGCISSVMYTGSGTYVPTGSGMSMMTGSGMPMMTGSLTWFTDGQFQTFSCQDTGSYLVEVKATDCNNNMTTKTTELRVVNDGGCSGLPAIAGQVLGYGTTPLEGVGVSAFSESEGYVSSTDQDGNYKLENLNKGSSYQVEVALQDLWRKGVNAYDLQLMQDYILGMTEFNMFQVASADVDGSTRVDARDLLIAKKIVLGAQTPITQESDPWIFSKDIEEGNLIPYQPSYINVDGTLLIDWLAVKKGDIDGDVMLEGETRSNTLVEILSNGTIENGYRYKLDFGNAANIAAFQMAMSIGDVDILEISGQKEIELYTENEGILSMLYFDSDPYHGSSDDLHVFITTSGPIEANLLDNLKPYAWSDKGEKKKINISTNILEAQADEVNRALHAFPNPTEGQVRLTLDQVDHQWTAPGRVSIIDAMGREVQAIRVSASQIRNHEISLQLPEVSGWYLIKVQSGDYQEYTRVLRN